MESSKKIFSIGVFGAIFDKKGRILCVKRAYAPYTWTTPGGAVSKGESLVGAFEREVEEETGFKVRPIRVVGAYFVPSKNDLALSIKAEIVKKEDWNPNEEIEKMGFFEEDDLPKPMNERTEKRIKDAFSKREGVLKSFEND